MTTEPTTATQLIDTDPSPGLPDVYPTAPITVSRDCAGWAWLCLSRIDLVTDEQRELAIAELHAALWPEARP